MDINRQTRKITMSDVFLPIPGYEGLYEISVSGQIRSIERQVRSGIPGGMRLVPSQIKKSSLDKRGYRVVQLCKDNKKKNVSVSRLLRELF